MQTFLIPQTEDKLRAPQLCAKLPLVTGKQENHLDSYYLDFILKEITSTDRDASVPESDTRYLFFLGLIRIEFPEQFWKDTQSIKYHFGWNT